MENNLLTEETLEIQEDPTSLNDAEETALTDEERTELERLRKKEANRQAFERRTKKTSKSTDLDPIWIAENIDDIKLCKEEFESYRSQGLTPEHALKLARLDRGLVTTSSTEVNRQTSVAQDSTISTVPPTTVPQDMIAKYGAEKAKELYEKYKDA